MEITPSSLNATFQGFNITQKDAFDSAPTFCDEICGVRNSTGVLENYAFLAKIPRFRVWVGERVWHNLTAYSQQVFNLPWEDGVEVDRDHIKDDQLGIYTDGIKLLGVQAKQLWDDLAVGLLQSGQTSLVYDGQNFFDANHPIIKGLASSGVQSNYTSTGFALTSANQETAVSQMMSLVGEDNHPLGVTPNVLMVPPQLRAAGKLILEAAFFTGGASNIDYQTAKLVVNPKLANQPTTWYLFDTQKGVKPVQTQIREAVSFLPLDQPNMPHVYERRVYRFGAEGRGNAAPGLWQLAFKGVA